MKKGPIGYSEAHNYRQELSYKEVEKLDRLDDFGNPMKKYIMYRRRGVEVREAYELALAFGINAKAQRERRFAHGTGATRNGKML